MRSSQSAGKAWYKSKTLWFNVLFLVLTLAGVFGYADFVPGQDIQQLASVLVLVLNLVLRVVFTKERLRR